MRHPAVLRRPQLAGPLPASDLAGYATATERFLQQQAGALDRRGELERGKRSASPGKFKTSRRRRGADLGVRVRSGRGAPRLGPPSAGPGRRRGARPGSCLTPWLTEGRAGRAMGPWCAEERHE
ncbi:hypothetical protein SFR_4879 [Streptomyces sp. FR-008]|nr:hypothetical protein SFR_4879 [Streptomyces sp. FR-008]